MMLKCRAECALALAAVVLMRRFLSPNLKELQELPGAGAVGEVPPTHVAFSATLASPLRWRYQTVLVDPPPCFGLA